MSVVPPTYLVDTSGQQWQLGVTNTPARITTTKVSAQVALASILLQDVATAQVWKLSIVPNPPPAGQVWGEITLTASSSTTSQTQIIVNSPNGATFAIQISNGMLQTTPAVVLCPITLSTFYAALSGRLYDPTNQFWTQAELLLYIQEAMRSWNALTGYWRGDFLFNAAQGVTWYDITQAANTLRPLTLTTTSLYTLIEYHLLEPPVGAGAWTGSAQFNLAALEAAVDRRREELLGGTGCSLTQTLIPAAPGRTALASNTLDVRRIAFIPAAGQGSPQTLWQDDTWGWESFEQSYATLPQGVPSTYALNTQPVFTFDVDASLNVPGQYELLTTIAGTDPALTVPDDWAWVIKWGALADLLGAESNAKDPMRAAYAEQRYRQGMELLSLAPALLGIRVNNIPVEIDSVRGADQYNTAWEGLAQGSPAMALVAGLNLIALTPPPDADAYSLTATVVENAPVPSNDTDCIPVTEDVYEAILDEAQHIAMFKSGGAEFAATAALHQRFLQAASLYASKLSEMGEFSQALYMQSQQESALNPRLAANTIGEAVESNG